MFVLLDVVLGSGICSVTLRLSWHREGKLQQFKYVLLYATRVFVVFDSMVLVVESLYSCLCIHLNAFKSE